jgi:hypothetical protein
LEASYLECDLPAAEERLKNGGLPLGHDLGNLLRYAPV